MNTAAPKDARPLRVLMVEDNPADVELCLRELRKAGYEARAEAVRDAEAFAAKLGSGDFDVILADASLPSWSGMEALAAARRSGGATPFILLTGTLREDEALLAKLREMQKTEPQ